MELHTPWTIKEESHLGDIAWSIFEATGLRIAVGFTRGDATLVCNLVNGEVVTAARALFEAEDAFIAFENDHPNDATKRWDAVFEAKCAAKDALRRVVLG